MVRIKKEKQEVIRKSILDVSRKMFFEDGYDQTSTSKIASAVGIAEGTVFNYFKTKADLLLSVMEEEFGEGLEITEPIDYGNSIVDIYYDYFKKVMKGFLILPKNIMLDIFMSLFKLSRKRPEAIRKLANIDFQFIDEIENISIELKNKKMIKDVDCRLLAENLYSVVIYEMVIYLYNSDYTVDFLYEQVYKKYESILKGCL